MDGACILLLSHVTFIIHSKFGKFVLWSSSLVFCIMCDVSLKLLNLFFSVTITSCNIYVYNAILAILLLLQEFWVNPGTKLCYASSSVVLLEAKNA